MTIDTLKKIPYKLDENGQRLKLKVVASNNHWTASYGDSTLYRAQGATLEKSLDNLYKKLLELERLP